MPPAKLPSGAAPAPNKFPAWPQSARLYVVHGDDELAIDGALDALKSEFGGSADMAGLNTHTLAASQLTLGALRHECDTIPFLSGHRLVIVRGFLSRIAPERRSRDDEPAEREDPAWKRAFTAELLAYLPALPQSTRLVFVEDKPLDASHRVLKLAQEWASRREAEVREYRRPSARTLPDRVAEMVVFHKGEIGPEAARLLADLVGPDMRLIDSEIEKLLAYTDGRPIAVQDVRILVSQAREAVIFELTDSMARRETARALRIAHQLMDEDAEPLWILAMLARQVRILLQVGVLRSERQSQQDIVSRLGLHPYVVEKALAQVGGFTRDKLEAAHRRLVATDWAIKTGEIEPHLALDLLVIELSA